MTKAAYQNYGHYVTDEWKMRGPKDMFTAVIAQMNEAGATTGKCLDIGCATGEFLYFLSQKYPGMNLSGADIFDELLVKAREHQPNVKFLKTSALDMPADLANSFDVVTAIGVMSIFDETQIDAFWNNLFQVTKPGGHIFVLAPLNDFGVDTMIRHRKRMDGKTGTWESGWNIFATETIDAIVKSHGATLKTVPFNISFDLDPRPDPVRTWTMDTENKKRQLTNGLKLLVDHQIMVVQKP